VVPVLFQVEAVPIVDAASAPLQPKLGRHADDDDRRARSRRQEDDDDRPRRRKRERRGLGAGAIVAIVMGAALFLGGVGFGIHALTRGSNAGGSDAGGSNAEGLNIGGLGIGRSKAPVPKGWVEYTSREDGFRIPFPEPPGRDEIPSGGRSWWRISRNYRAGQEDGVGVAVHVNVYSFRRKLSAEEQEGVMKDMLGLPSLMKSVQWAGRSVKEKVILRGDCELVDRFFTTETRFFNVMVASPKDGSKREIRDGVFDNFQLVD
jgi:hypothetical protein